MYPFSYDAHNSYKLIQTLQGGKYISVKPFKHKVTYTGQGNALDQHLKTQQRGKLNFEWSESYHYYSVFASVNNVIGRSLNSQNSSSAKSDSLRL